MNHFFQSIEKSFGLTDHIGTSVLIILFAKVSSSIAMVLSVFSQTYSYLFSILSIISVSLVILCHWRKGINEAIIIYQTIQENVKRLRKKFSKKDK